MGSNPTRYRLLIDNHNHGFDKNNFFIPTARVSRALDKVEWLKKENKECMDD